MSNNQITPKQLNNQPLTYFLPGYKIPRSAFGGSGSKCWNCHQDAGTITLPSGGKCCANCGAAR